MPPGSPRDGFLGTPFTLEHGLVVVTAAVLDPCRIHGALAVLGSWREAVSARPGCADVLVHLRVVADVIEGYPVPVGLSRQAMGPIDLLEPLRARLEQLQGMSANRRAPVAVGSGDAAA